MIRRRVKATVASFAAACLMVPAQGALAAFEIQHWTNKHDVPVYFVELPELPMVNMQLRFIRSGHARNGEKHGLASITSKMIRQGAKGMNADQIAETFAGVGARMGIGANYDSTTAGLQSLTEEKYLEPALQAYINVLSSPSFPQEQFERIRKIVLTNIENKYQNPQTLASEEFRKAVYRNHPYAYPGSGTKETVTAMKIGDVQDFYKKHYVTSNLIITLVGAISRERASAIADKITGSIEKGVPAEKLPPIPEIKEAVTIRVAFPSEQAHVMVGQPFIKANDPDRYALHLGNGILGSSGFGSRLFEEIRVNRGFAYSIRSAIHSSVATGFFRVSFQTRIDQVDEALSATDKVIRDFVTSGPTEEEVAMETDRIRGSNVFATDSNRKIFSAVSRIAFHKWPLDYLDTYISNYEKENRASIMAAYRKHLDPNKMVTVIVGGAAE